MKEKKEYQNLTNALNIPGLEQLSYCRWHAKFDWSVWHK